MGLTVPAFLKLQSEFMPPLNEGTVLYMPTAPPGMSVTEASNVLQAMDRQLKSFPEVVSVFGKAGRAETATDPAPIGMFETTIVLKPRDRMESRPHVAGLDPGDGRNPALPGHAQHLLDAGANSHRNARDRHSKSLGHPSVRE